MTKEITGWENEFEMKYLVGDFGDFYEKEDVIPLKAIKDFINHQIASAVEARESKIGEHILAIGHNDECMFCGFKDKFATSIINPSKE